MPNQSASNSPVVKSSRRRKLLGCTIVLAGALVLTAPFWYPQLFTPPTENPVLDPATAETGTLPSNMGVSWQVMDDPTRDGWDTEVFNLNAGKQLKALAKLISQSTRPSAKQFAPLLTDEFSCASLWPAKREVVHQDSLFHIERSQGLSKTKAFHGALGFQRAVQALRSAFPKAAKLRCKFKLFRVERSDTKIVTRQYVSISGHGPDGWAEQNATWVMHWLRPRKDTLPRLSWIGVARMEHVRTKHASGPLFVDCARSVLEQNACYEKQFLHGMNHWFGRSQERRYLDLLGNPGLAIGDVNGDGLEDLYVCQEEGLPNRLFLGQPDGSAREVSAEWGVDWLQNSRGVLLVDWDNDGDQDLAVAMVGCVILASNERNRFQVRTVLPTDDDTMSLSAADYDNDGDLDLFVCVYFAKEKLLGQVRGLMLGGVGGSGQDSEMGGGQNALFRNDGDKSHPWKFTDVTKAVGLDHNNQRYSFAAAWEDYDNDGDQDLYIANDHGRNNLYRNDQGTFTDVAEKIQAEDRAFGMSVTWSDFDQDGWMDVYVSNMFSSAGERVTFQERFQKDQPKLKRLLQRFARGNTLLRNQGDGTFTDVSEDQGVTIGRWAWGSHFFDMNNDSRDDLVVANGYLTTEDSGDL